MIYTVVFVLGVQERDSLTHIHISFPFQIPFPYSLRQSVESHSLCSTVCVLGVQECDSLTHIHISNLFRIPFPYSLQQSVESISPCSQWVLVDYLLYIYIYICVYMFIPTS